MFEDRQVVEDAHCFECKGPVKEVTDFIQEHQVEWEAQNPPSNRTAQEIEETARIKSVGYDYYWCADHGAFGTRMENGQRVYP